MTEKWLGVVVGSLRRDSMNRKLARALVKLAPDTFHFEYPDIAVLPHYNQDLEADVPEAVQAFREQLHSLDGFMFVVPEYNRGMPGVVKNALDWGSRPKGHSGWAGKPALLTGASAGAISTAAMQVHLRAILSSMGMYPLGEPEAYIRYHDGLIGENHEVTVEGTRGFLQLVMDGFVELLHRFD